jgi:hypothetical protein
MGTRLDPQREWMDGCTYKPRPPIASHFAGDEETRRF